MFRLKQKPDYKWAILFACTLMVFVCLGFCSGNKGLYLTAVTDALGIKRSLFSMNETCRYIATAFINLFFGSLLYKFGVRKMTAFGFATLIASTLLFAYAEDVVGFCIAGGLLGVGLSFTTTTMASSVIRRWFKKDIGRYTGIAFASNGIGTALAAQIVSPMINEPGNPFGYRKSYLVVAAILLATGILVVALLKERPQNEQIRPDDSHKKTRSVSWQGIDYATAKQRPYFYITCIVVVLTGFILQGISGAYAAHLKDINMDPAFIATVVSVFALALTGSKLLVGFLYDKFGLRAVMLLCQGATVVAFVLLAVLDNSVLGMAGAVIFAVLYALALPLETLAVPLIVNDLFGAASYDKLLGILSAMNYAGYALSAPLVNLCYDITGSYTPILLLFSFLMIPTAVVFQFALRASDKEKEGIRYV